MIDINESMNRIYNRLGLTSDYLYTKFTPMDLKGIIDIMTLPVFSKYHPFSVPVRDIKFMDSDQVSNFNENKRNRVYKFPAQLETIVNGGKILWIDEFEVSGDYGFSSYDTGYSSVGGLGINTGGWNSYGGFDIGGVARAITDATNGNPPIRARFVAPNMVEILTRDSLLSGIGLDFKVKFEHNTSWYTIDEGLVTKFEDLATLDLMIYLWENEFKYIDKTNLGNSGEIDLKMSEYEEAKATRKDLIDRYKRNKLIGRKKSYYVR